MATKKKKYKTRRERTFEWLVRYWRPAMAWQYFAVCVFDFLLAPFFQTIIQASQHIPLTQWHPISLESGGLYHLSMGAIVSLSAWSRTKEKLEMMKQLGLAEATQTINDDNNDPEGMGATRNQAVVNKTVGE